MVGDDIRGKRVTVIGAARSGIAVAQLLVRHGAQVLITDSAAGSLETKRLLGEEGIETEFGGHSERAADADFFAISPGVPDHVPFVASLVERNAAIYSEVEIASWFCSAPIVAVTGTNGKTTTTALAAHLFRSAGRTVTMAGNMGDPFARHADRVGGDDVVVLEVSSFQLDHIHSLRPKVASILNITPDHLDRYQNDFEKYVDSKFRILMNQGKGDAFIFNADDPAIRHRMTDTSQAEVSTFGISTEGAVDQGAFVRNGDIVFRLSNQEEVLMPHEELSLRGRHNLYNSLAASMAARFLEVSDDVIRESMRTFGGIPNRLEMVREVDGVTYVNDSKATNVNAVWYALESFDKPVVLIAGGLDKGNDYSEIAPLVSEKARALITLGSGAAALENALADYARLTRRAGSLEEAVKMASQIARPGDIVLLSPACASLDMFENYEHRGEVFRRAVESL